VQIIPFIPETAPFDADQRLWLNGYTAGLLAGKNLVPANANGAANGPAAPTVPLLVLFGSQTGTAEKLARRIEFHCAENRGAIRRIGGDIEPLAAIYPRAARTLAATRLNEQSNAVKHFAERCVEADLASFVDLAASDAGFFANWNSPADSKQSTMRNLTGVAG
jgi:hypothetical protein